MENKELMDKLLQTNPGINNDFQPQKQNTQQSNISYSEFENENSSLRRVDIAKYKLYCITFSIFLCLFWLIWIPEINNKLERTQNAYNTANNSLASVQKDIRDAEDSVKYLNEITENEDNVKRYLNSKGEKDCSILPESWKNGDSCKTKIPLSFLQITSLYNEKMAVDEKKILRNLKEYLIRDEMDSEQRAENGDILSISIGDPEPADFNGLLSTINNLKGKYGQRDSENHFYRVPVKVTISFDTVEDLIKFLYNIERKIIDTSSDRILYKIQKVSYDVVSHDEPQVTDIEMIAYYYYDEKFKEDVTSEESESENNTVEQNTENTNSESSFIDDTLDTIASRFN